MLWKDALTGDPVDELSSLLGTTAVLERALGDVSEYKCSKTLGFPLSFLLHYV